MREWVRLYTSSWGHRKMLGLSLEAHGLWAIGLAYAGSQEREDFVPESLVMRVTRYGCDSEEDPEVSRPEELVKAGLWEPVEGGWLIHNHEVRQSDEEARKEVNRIRQQRYREARNALRNGDSHTPVTPVTRLEKRRVEKSREEAAPNGAVDRIFELWRVETGHLQAKLTQQRRRAVRARLSEGYTEDDLTDAVRGVALDPWPERVHHNDLEVICRNGAHVEKFRDLWRNPHPVVPLARGPENPIDRRIREFGRGLEVTA